MLKERDIFKRETYSIASITSMYPSDYLGI